MLKNSVLAVKNPSHNFLGITHTPYMKKYVIRAPFLTGVFALLFALPFGKNAELKDIAKPYLGEYECVQAEYGNHDYLSRFSSIVLELRDKNEFLLYYREKNGKERTVRGKYFYDENKKTLKLSSNKGEFQREFPMEKGVLNISVPIHGKLFILQFAQK